MAPKKETDKQRLMTWWRTRQNHIGGNVPKAPTMNGHSRLELELGKAPGVRLVLA